MVLYPKYLFELYKKTGTGTFSNVPIVLSGFTQLSFTAGLESVKDVLTIRIPNNRVNTGVFTTFLGKQDAFSNLMTIDDEIKLYFYYDILPEDKDDALIVSGRVTGFSYALNGASPTYSIKVINRTEELLNAMTPYSSRANSGTNNTSPLAIKQMISRLNQFHNNDRWRFLYATLTTEKVKYGDKELTGTYGNIAASRTKSYTDPETGSSTTAFPTIDYNETWKPVYYNIEKLSGTEYTGDTDAGNYICYIKYTPVLPQYQQEFGKTINELVWKPKTTTLYGSLVHGQDFINPTVKLDVKDIQNCLIINAGTDFQNAGITGVQYDLDSMGKFGIKIGYFTGLRQTFSKIAIREMNHWKNNYGATQDTDGMPLTADFPHQMSFPEKDWRGAVSFPITYPTATDKTEYNNYLRNEARFQAQTEAKDILKKLGTPRYSLTADTVYGNTTLVLGEIYAFVIPSYGWDGTTTNPAFKIRIKNINHTFDANGWTTRFEAEEDEKVVSEFVGNKKTSF